MFKFVGGIVFGVFVGALALEVIGRTRPQIIEKVQNAARKKARSMDNFMDGDQREDPLV